MALDDNEPAINAPWPVLALIGAILAAFAAQGWLGVDTLNAAYGFSPADMVHGRRAPLILSLFLHASWVHALANCAFGLAFGSAVSRRMGVDAKGAGAFFGFYLLCGVIANLTYALIHPGDIHVVIGASGAVAALMGAASRLMGRGPGLESFASRPVVSMALAWFGVNILFGAVLVGWAPGAGGAPIAWEVHLAGYAAGLLLISPTLKLIGRLPVDHAIGH